ncbi:MAG: pilus assembly protein [Proteobacteria bacterium]|nr:pilus assembly protein [Pseudomonadota bacterium]
MAGQATSRRWPSLKFASLRRFNRDERGATAVEFAIVLTPFLMFIFALIGCSLYFFVSNSLERGMDQTSRLIRTGEAVTDKMTVAQFKQAICDSAGGWIKCDKLQVWAQSWSSWSAIGVNNPTDDTGFNSNGIHSCVDQNNTASVNNRNPTDPIATYTGGASDVVIVTTCYQWEYASRIPYIRLGNMQNGTMMIQSSTAFRTEPFPGTGS